MAVNDIPDGAVPAAASLAATRLPLESARTLPAAFYTSPAVLQIEQKALFPAMWLCIGREEDAANPGDFFTVDIGDERILVVRGKDAVVRAFFNVCRHRGARLVDEPCGQGRTRLSCPYHAWTYGLDGKLVAAPFMEGQIALDEFPLLDVRLDTWGGFLFVNLDGAAPALDEYLADLPDIARYKLNTLRRGHRIRYQLNANWKIVCENYSECYHCALVHPQLNRLSPFVNEGGLLKGNCFNGGPMELREGVGTLSTTGEPRHPPIAGLTEEDHRLVHYFVIYPNLLLGLHPDYVLVHTAMPQSAGRTRVVCDWLFTEEALAEPDFDPSEAVDFWDVTNRQDWGLCERVQRGAGSRAYRPGPYQQTEACVHEFDRWYAEAMSALL
ncbi:MAG: aromatic ring-hydroxylating dioxygenase subunit alpha [Pseudomonadota bacterium]